MIYKTRCWIAPLTMIVGAILLLNGCMVGPDYQRPKTAADKENFANAPKEQKELECQSNHWWLSFDDSVTNMLVEKALENNTDLQASALAITQSQALLKASYGRRLPTVNYNGSVTRNRNVVDNPLTGKREGIYSTNYDLGLSVSYVTDIFGKLKRNEKAAIAELWATQANREALEHTITALVVKSRIQISQLHELLEIAQENTHSWGRTLKTIERRYNQGLLKPEDLHMARENHAASQATEPELEQRLILAYNSLDVLLGQKPGTAKQFEKLKSALPNLEPIPTGLPASLLDRRPDLRVAEFRVMAANQRVGASIASLYPDLTFTASGSLRDTELHDLLDWENRIYTLIAGLTGPIFRGGSLKADVKLKKAQLEQASVKYAGLVLKAMREVEDALVTHQKQQDVLKYVQIRNNEAHKAETLATERYLAGASGSFLKVLETQRRRRLAENQLVQTQSAIWNNRVSLYLALGGDWQSETAKNNGDNK